MPQQQKSAQQQLNPPCPFCKYKLTRRSRHVSFYEWLKCRLRHLEVHRCLNCDERFYAYEPKQADTDE